MMMNFLKINNFKRWREIVLFFAAFFCLSYGVTSCKKKKNPVGADVLPAEDIMSSDGVDTFKLATYTVEEDSIFSMDPDFNLLGSYTDEVFGKVEANFYTQFTLSGFSPNFGNLSEVVIDSAVMAFEYGGYYGDLTEQNFEVYEITEELTRDSSYMRTSSAAVNSQQLVPTANNEGLIYPDPEEPAIVGQDTLSPQLRIPLDTIFGRNMLQLAQNANNDDDFLQSFKGLHFKVNNGLQSPGEGTIIYLATNKPGSKMTVYYTNANGEQAKFDFIVTNSAIDFNHVETDYSNTRIEQVINDPALGQSEYYAQSFSTRAKIEFPSIEDLPENVIIHKATLELPVSYYQGSNFYPSAEVSVSSEIDGKKYLVPPRSAPFNSSRKAYLINMREYIQKVIQGEFPNSGIFISPKKYNTTTERIMFNGVNSLNKKKPKLSIVYTVL